MEENRMIGKTTRTVDHAVQILFTEGKIHVPNKNQIKDEKYSRGKIKNQIIIDPDWDSNYAVQETLFRKIKHRLIYEHGMRVDTDPNIKINESTIFLTDPKFVKDGI